MTKFTITMKAPDGTIGEVKRDLVKQALKEGFTLKNSYEAGAWGLVKSFGRGLKEGLDNFADLVGSGPRARGKMNINLQRWKKTPEEIQKAEKDLENSLIKEPEYHEGNRYAKNIGEFAAGLVGTPLKAIPKLALPLLGGAVVNQNAKNSALEREAELGFVPDLVTSLIGSGLGGLGNKAVKTVYNRVWPKALGGPKIRPPKTWVTNKTKEKEIENLANLKEKEKIYENYEKNLGNRAVEKTKKYMGVEGNEDPYELSNLLKETLPIGLENHKKPYNKAFEEIFSQIPEEISLNNFNKKLNQEFPLTNLAKELPVFRKSETNKILKNSNLEPNINLKPMNKIELEVGTAAPLQRTTLKKILDNKLQKQWGVPSNVDDKQLKSLRFGLKQDLEEAIPENLQESYLKLKENYAKNYAEPYKGHFKDLSKIAENDSGDKLGKNFIAKTLNNVETGGLFKGVDIAKQKEIARLAAQGIFDKAKTIQEIEEIVKRINPKTRSNLFKNLEGKIKLGKDYQNWASEAAKNKFNKLQTDINKKQNYIDDLKLYPTSLKGLQEAGIGAVTTPFKSGFTNFKNLPQNPVGRALALRNLNNLVFGG